MPAFHNLVIEETYNQKSWVILPHHPTIGEYSKSNTCSFPNPMLHAGTLFIRPENSYIQEVFPSDRKTAFVVNTTAYRSVSRGFTIALMDDAMSDSEVVEKASSILKLSEPALMRIHLQNTGAMGTEVALFSEGKSYQHQIFADSSPYVDAVRRADSLLGVFIEYLKEEDLWEGTVLIVTSDHGQSDVGWHPLLDENSWITPLVFAGEGIARGRRLPYFEHIDLAPTICSLFHLDPPNQGGGAGKAVTSILESGSISNDGKKEYVKTINRQIKEYHILKSQLILRAEKRRPLSNTFAALENENLTPEPFYHENRIMEWHQAKTIEQMIEANEQILLELSEALND